MEVLVNFPVFYTWSIYEKYVGNSLAIVWGLPRFTPNITDNAKK